MVKGKKAVLVRERPSIFDKLEKIFTKGQISKEEWGAEGFMMLRALSMRQEYLESINRIQKYQGVLGFRLAVLLQNMFTDAVKTPFLDYVKRAEEYDRFSKKASEKLRGLFLVSDKRLAEYLPNLWVTEEEVREIWGLE